MTVVVAPAVLDDFRESLGPQPRVFRHRRMIAMAIRAPPPGRPSAVARVHRAVRAGAFSLRHPSHQPSQRPLRLSTRRLNPRRRHPQSRRAPDALPALRYRPWFPHRPRLPKRVPYPRRVLRCSPSSLPALRTQVQRWASLLAQAAARPDESMLPRPFSSTTPSSQATIASRVRWYSSCSLVGASGLFFAFRIRA